MQTSNRFDTHDSHSRSRATDSVPHSPSRRQALGWLLAVASSPLLPGCSGGDVKVVVDGDTAVAAPWADDIQTFAANVRATHPDPNGITRSAAWQSLLAQITATAGQKSDKANLVESMRLAALMGDDHTRIGAPAGTFAQTAIRFAAAADGIWVQQATTATISLLGAHLLAIDGITIAEVSERLKAIIPSATVAAFASQTPLLLHQTELLWIAGIGLTATQSTYLLSDSSGVQRSVTLPAGDSAPLISIYDRAGGPATPLWLTQPDRYYFRSMMAGSQSVYVRYARCAIDPLTPIDVFFDGVAQALSTLPAPRLIFDLRNNPGGDSSLLAGAIQQRLASGVPTTAPRVAVLINGGSFSSATTNLYDLRRLGARSFGEPPGTAPNHTSEVRNFTLPRTGTQYILPTRLSVLEPALGETNYTPDVPVGPSIDDRANGRDPILDRAELYLRTGV